MHPPNPASIIKQKLDTVISDTVGMASLFVKHPGVDFTRNRILDLTTLLRLILSMGGNSINKEILDFFQGSAVAPTASAFVQQRDKILPDLFLYVLRAFNDACEDVKLYKGYRLLAVDSSAITIATDPSETSYMKASLSDKGINQLQLSAMYDLLNRTYADCVMQDRVRMDERRALIDMMKRSSREEKRLMIADRGYESLNLFEHFHKTENHDYLIRVKNEKSLKEIADLPMRELDCNISFTVTTLQTKEVRARGYKWVAGQGKYKERRYSAWDHEPVCPMTLRVVRFKISEDTFETIVTSLDRFQFPLAEIKKLYHMRWGIETSFRELKYVLGLVSFHCKKQEYAIQEIYARLIMYNFCERITLAAVIVQSDSRKHLYQANFTMGIHICLRFYRHTGNDPPDVMALITKYILPVRENRKDKRNLKIKGLIPFAYRIA